MTAPHDRLPRHGGGLAEATRRFGAPPGGWLDLSTGINRRPWPLPALPADAWTRLPDADAVAGLRRAAAAYMGVGDPAVVVPVPGTQAVIQALPRLSRPRRVAVLGPTYGEHALAWRAAGHEVAVVAEAPPAGAADVVVVVNPNNPDGRLSAPANLLVLAESLAARGGLLVVDEAFADATPDVSLATALPRPGVVVLRSFGKFFGLAGLRLGLALAPPELAARLEAALGPWAVSGPALHIGAHAYADAAWIAETRRWLGAQTAAVDAVLGGAGLAVVGGTPLFRLVRAVDAWALYERLAARGVLTRPFAHDRGLLRVGIPGSVAELQRLQSVLASQ